MERPAVVLFEYHENVVIAGITSNTGMDGIPFLKSEGAAKDRVIKLNCIFTVSYQMISKVLIKLSYEKRKQIFNLLTGKFKRLDTDH